jgi:hypothetical protein
VIRRVAVVVPAADEQARMAACLQAIERARRQLLDNAPGIDRVDVFVVLDACTDRTPEIVNRFASRYGTHVVTSSARCVGIARGQGALQAIAQSAPPARPAQLWLANTDADSEVPADWLTSMVSLADEGARVVLGTVSPGEDLPTALRASWLAAHRQHDGHPHVHGANFGVRADTYLALGGWPSVPNDEDVELAKRAVAAGILIVRTGAIPVITSARLIGRAPDGFSSYLRHLRDHQAVVRPIDRRAG